MHSLLIKVAAVIFAAAIVGYMVAGLFFGALALLNWLFPGWVDVVRGWRG